MSDAPPPDPPPAPPRGNRREAADRLLTNPLYSLNLARRAINGFSWNGAALLVLAGATAYREVRPIRREYFASNGQNDPYPIHPLSEPVVTNLDLLDWTVKAVVRAYSYDFVRRREQAEEAKANFESQAWDSWAAQFVKSGNLAKIVEAKMVTRAQPRDAAVVRQEGVVQGRYVWKVQFPMLLAFENTNGGPPPETHLMEVLVARSAEARHRRGIAIAQLVEKPWYGDQPAPKVAIR